MIRQTGMYILNSNQIDSLIKRFNGRLLETNELVDYTIEELKGKNTFSYSIEIVNNIIVQSEKIFQLLENFELKQ